MIILLLIFCCAVASVGLGCAYQGFASRRDRRRYTNTGRLIDIGNQRYLFVVEKGTGTATVIFDSGIAATHLSWCDVQEQVSQFAGTVSYDRCGLGWSSSSRTDRTPANTAGELHDALRCASINPPYILVGHSFGGMVMRRFALLYPAEVAGLVLVDPMRCCEWPPINADRQSTLNGGVRCMRYAIPVPIQGWPVLLSHPRSVAQEHLRIALPMHAARADATFSHASPVNWPRCPVKSGRSLLLIGPAPIFTRECRATLRPSPRPFARCAAEPIADIPVLVLTPGKSRPLDQEELDSIGHDIRQVIASQSAHWIHLDEPEMVIQSILEMTMASVPQAVR